MPSTSAGSTTIDRSPDRIAKGRIVRVIAGLARGRPLTGPRGARTRPTSDKVKGALFSMLETLLAARRPGSESDAPEGVPGDPAIWSALNIADYYAGTGALGIEALSRGAAWCDFFETDASARRVIARNLKATDLTNQARIVALDVLKVGGSIDALHLPFGVVLMDPPYNDSNVSAAIGRLMGGSLLAANALVAVEHSHVLILSDTFGSVAVADDGEENGGRLLQLRERRHGDTVVTIYRWISSPDRGVVDADHGDLSG